MSRKKWASRGPFIVNDFGLEEGQVFFVSGSTPGKGFRALIFPLISPQKSEDCQPKR